MKSDIIRGLQSVKDEIQNNNHNLLWCIKHIDKAIQEINKIQEWIYVDSKVMPENGQEVLVSIYGGEDESYTMTAVYHSGQFISPLGTDITESVKAWKDRPEPCK